MVTKALPPGEIKMTQGYNLQETVEIHREECAMGKRTLGTWINPVGQITHKDSTVQTEYMVRMGQAQAWGTSITQSSMTKFEAHMAYHGILQAKIRYVLAVKTFS